MEHNSFFSQLDETGKNFLEYVKARAELLGLNAFEIAVKSINNLIAATFYVSLLMIGFLFIAFAAAYYIGDLLDSIQTGFAIMGVVFLLASFLVYLRRKKIFQNMVIKEMVEILFDEEQKSHSQKQL